MHCSSLFQHLRSRPTTPEAPEWGKLLTSEVTSNREWVEAPMRVVGVPGYYRLSEALGIGVALNPVFFGRHTLFQVLLRFSH